MEQYLNVPQFSKDFEEYESSCGSVLRLFRNASETSYDAYLQKLTDAGFDKVFEHSIDGNFFASFSGHGLSVQANFFRADEFVRVSVDTSPLPPYEVEKVKPRFSNTFWQFEVGHALIDCGMCYILRCCDGSFLLIDSAHPYSETDDRRLHDFLRAQTPENEKIVIAGWFFTHGHIDHIGQFLNFLRYQCNDVTIERLYFNFIPNNHRDNADWDSSDLAYVNTFYKTLYEYPNLPVCRLHTGQVIAVRDVLVHVLCTHEDVFPEDNSNYNDSSAVLMLTASGTKILIPGDAGQQESRLLEQYYPNFLASPIVQAAHHGHFGTSAHFYELVNAQIVLFPTTRIKFDEELPNYEANRTAVRLAKKVFVSSDGTVEIPLPLHLDTIKVYDDETFESFSGVFDLWGYSYSEERMHSLYHDYLCRGGAILPEYEGWE